MSAPTRAAIRAGTITPMRPVPTAIARPHYAPLSGTKAKDQPWDFDDSPVKTAEIIEKMRHAGRIAAMACDEVGKHVVPGVTTEELDRVGHEFLIDHGAYPSTLGYKGFPKSLCSSVNEIVCHGIPDDLPLEMGDVVKIDVTAFVDGVHGDTCATFFAGEPSEQVRLLSERTHEAMMRGIKAARPGRPISVIGRVIESYARRFDYGVIRDFTGHGVGPSFHTKPTIWPYDEPRATTLIESGMTFTIEPMLTLGGYAWEMWPDGWTIVTKDKSWVAQWEHTLHITDDGAEILTLSES
ncbi:MAG: methionyl aminopeptidase [Pseudonocardiales bacterium]|nr:methionyl aminopeptidase [Pseudonocardiales bacterium]